ncbi:MAG: hypothetical protein AYL32_004880 [Candidatus Bathyarchaeota archaeon B26-2]|nr:MAG: hypothetical protein AYL32_004880 [Candidatus Bathyarchaeota archaeon B26-2]
MGDLVEIRGVDIHPSALFGTDPEEGPRRVAEIVRLAAERNLNFLRPFVVGTRCNASYESRIVPVKEFEGWDPLKVLIDEAHKRGLEVHPFICVVPQGVEKLGQPLLQHPEWAMVKRDGRVIGWGNPAHPEFRRYVKSIVLEVAENYDVDGLSFDYLRYPGRDVDYSEYSRERFKEEYGVDPLDLTEGSQLYEAWRLWRVKQTATLMEEIHEAVKKVKPEILLSAYVWTVRDPYICLRDWVDWVRKGYLDAINPTGYVYDYREYMDRCRTSIKAAKEANPEVPVFINVGVYTSHGRLRDASQVIKWTEGAREAGADGVSFFTMKTLMPYLKEVSEALFRDKAKVPRPA